MDPTMAKYSLMSGLILSTLCLEVIFNPKNAREYDSNE